MGKAKEKSKYRKKRRSFHGNRHTGADKHLQDDENRQEEPNNSSFTKLKSTPQPAQMETSQSEGMRIIDMSLLCQFITSFPCPNCSGLLEVSEGKLCGLASKLTAHCQSCDFENSFHTSKRGHGKAKFFLVNRQYTLAMCAIGRNRQQAVRFSANMDMPQPVALEHWRKHLGVVSKVTQDVAEVSMRRAANSVRNPEEPVSDITVSCDGT